ncbi:SusC/RagA family TonB-linked outer membrane protein [Paraflavitalea speifideaquila]|uniref:SusC/RagA family TonB-linked outer membrane protein n=1 Tax=Paraflavitalea speifideaquila TaxID=3076558 RepID=UPI0028E28E39|nr:TonB-dependent receptor plug domain-containing protein [Paraflavitalea speifideiaquila]
MNATIEEVLEQCFKNQPLHYTISDNVISIKEKQPEQSPASGPPPIDIRGTVYDDKGKPLAGVSVLVIGEKQGVSTDDRGTFSITVSENAVLSFSYIGYKTTTVAVKGKRTIDITLSPDIASMSDVVVVGYGTQRKENLTGAVATVSSKELDSRPLTTLGQGLQGLVPNLNIDFTNGKPGTGANFNIRGTTSINAGSTKNGEGLGGPLIIVDGTQMDPNLINPADIESVTVLKDAASAAIYGSRGAFGVILITTKSGKKTAACVLTIPVLIRSRILHAYLNISIL